MTGDGSHDVGVAEVQRSGGNLRLRDLDLRVGAVYLRTGGVALRMGVARARERLVDLLLRDRGGIGALEQAIVAIRSRCAFTACAAAPRSDAMA